MGEGRWRSRLIASRVEGRILSKWEEGKLSRELAEASLRWVFDASLGRISGWIWVVVTARLVVEWRVDEMVEIPNRRYKC